MRSESEAQELIGALAKIDEILAWPDQRLYALVETVSRWSAAQQVQHVLLALERFATAIRTLEHGTDAAIVPDGAPRLVGRLLLFTGWIPRGRAEAPDAVVPDAVPSRAGLRDAFDTAHEPWGGIADRARGLDAVVGALPHPLLGPFRAAHWLRFARMHTNHHLGIIADIDRTEVVGEPDTDHLAPIGGSP